MHYLLLRFSTVSIKSKGLTASHSKCIQYSDARPSPRHSRGAVKAKMDWANLVNRKVALVTGAASGIGRATAKLFAQHGAQVVLVDVNEPGGTQAVNDIRAQSGDALFIKADVGDMQQVSGMISATLDHYGRLDIVYSNAASYRLGSASEISEADWDYTQSACLKASWMIAHHAMPAMLRNDRGSFIITASVQAIRGYKRHCAYQAAKGGLLSLTRSLAADYAPKIRVNAILPGAVVTGIAAGLSDAELKRIALMCPLQRNARPEEIAMVALFLASDMSAYMTGACVVVDGGLSSVIQMD
jgi:NAD(P)-dependent dehydrogenase (short-subunit alcohol dehydrogenase family)